MNDWIPIAQVASAIVSAIGLFISAIGLCLTACQMSRSRRTVDLQAIQKFSDDADKHEAALVPADSEDSHQHALNVFLNFLELYACAYNNGLIIGDGSREIVRHRIIDSYIALAAATEWHSHIATEALDSSTTFKELIKLIRCHRKEVNERKAEKCRRFATP
jgi:hypothetical protein